jgi:hypothetical protein
LSHLLPHLSQPVYRHQVILMFACTMSWKGTHAVVELVTTVYRTGVKLTKEAMERMEARLKRTVTSECP